MTADERAIRRAGPADAEAIVAVLVAVAEEGGYIATEAPVDVPARVATMRATLGSDEDVMWVMEAEGAVVGTMGLHATGARGVPALGMALVAAWRGRGAGTALLRTALAHAVADPGTHKVELEVWPDNERAIALYRRHGFTLEGMRHDHWRRRDGSLRSALLMSRAVVASGEPRPVLEAALPVLVVADVAAAAAFLRDGLGFADAGASGDLTALARDGAIVLLAPGTGAPATAHVVVPAGLDALREELRARGLEPEDGGNGLVVRGPGGLVLTLAPAPGR